MPYLTVALAAGEVSDDCEGDQQHECPDPDHHILKDLQQLDGIQDVLLVIFGTIVLNDTCLGKGRKRRKYVTKEIYSLENDKSPAEVSECLQAEICFVGFWDTYIPHLST